MNTLSVKNFEQFQHYKDRTPPWIKLYNTTLDDYEFGRLSDASKWHLVAIWLLASRYDNKIPDDAEWISSKANAITQVDIEALVNAGFLIRNNTVQSASKPQAPRSETARPERESETEVEREKDTAAGEPTFDRVKVVGERVLEAAGIDPARWLGHFAPISGWLRAGADPEFDIYPTIKQLTKRTGYTPPRSLNYFTDAILRAHAERMADPVPSGEPGKVRELRQERTPEEREWLDAYKTWAKAGRNGPPPQRAQFVKKEAAS